MRDFDSLFAASIAVAITFLTYYLVRNVFFNKWIRPEHGAVRKFGVFTLMVVLLAPVMLGLAGMSGTDPKAELYSTWTAYYGIYFAVVYFINWYCFTHLLKEDEVLDDVLETLDLTFSSHGLIMDHDKIVINVSFVNGVFKAEYNTHPDSKPLDKKTKIAVTIDVLTPAKP